MKQCTVAHYAEEFKESSAKLAVESSQAISQTARELGVGCVDPVTQPQGEYYAVDWKYLATQFCIWFQAKLDKQ
jgi:hypothetical protein